MIKFYEEYINEFIKDKEDINPLINEINTLCNNINQLNKDELLIDTNNYNEDCITEIIKDNLFIKGLNTFYKQIEDKIYLLL